MIERRVADRRTGLDRRAGRERRVSDREETEWLPPYGRRKLDGTDSRQKERRVADRREES